jgi:hypothetical protein
MKLPMLLTRAYLVSVRVEVLIPTGAKATLWYFITADCFWHLLSPDVHVCKYNRYLLYWDGGLYQDFTCAMCIPFYEFQAVAFDHLHGSLCFDNEDSNPFRNFLNTSLPVTSNELETTSPHVVRCLHGVIVFAARVQCAYACAVGCTGCSTRYACGRLRDRCKRCRVCC